jgi:hypothetical protein
MKSENKICLLLALLYSLPFLFFGLLLLFFSLPVHAATVTPTGNIFVEVEGAVNDYCNRNIKVYSGDATSLKCAILTMDENKDVKNLNGIVYTTDISSEFTYYSVTSSTWPNQPQNNSEDVIKMTSSGMGKVTLSDGTIVRYSIAGLGKTDWSIISNTPCYDPISGLSSLTSAEQAKIFLEHLLVVGDLKPNNGGSDFDPHDDAYAFTGFSMSGKTATWTGTTERSYLLDMDVEEWVNYSYGFATSEDQEVSSFIDAEAHYPTSDKKLALPWDEMEANKKEGEFIRQVNIIPCYGTSGAGFYFGLPCKVFYHKDGSVDKVELPASNGILSSDMERPVIVLNEASNGYPVGGDYSYFRFNNAQEDYFIEMKGRWYSTNDFDLYRENLVWKYKYQTILKNDLSSWVSVSDNVNSVGTFRFDVLGKSSWENLLSLYPVDNRNYEGGSFALFNKITGYSDALDTLKMLLKQPYSLYNGYEIYVRYYRYDDKGNLQYSKWTHFYNNLADAAGSSGSRLDDLNNMYSENQSDKGLTDDELSDLENTGNSRNDLDAVPKNNYDYSSLENATMNFFDLLTNFGTMLGQFPSMVAAVFGFLPSWLIGLIAVAIGAVIVCRFIGR